MIICAAGDIHGAIDRLYDDVLDFETHLGLAFDHILHVGDFGIWPDPSRIDRATRRHDGAGDFQHWLTNNRAAPWPTTFIKGNHEDFDWLAEREAEDNLEILPGLRYLPNGRRIDLTANDVTISVGGIGGCFAAADYAKQSSQLVGRARSHYTHDEVERLRAGGSLDLVLLHDAPAGVELAKHNRAGLETGRYVSDADGLADVVLATKPRLCFFGHHHTRAEATIGETRCIGLNLVGRAGYLTAAAFAGSDGSHEILGEWLPAA